MKKNLYSFIPIILIFSSLAVASGERTRANVNFNVNLGPPPIMVEEPPEVVMMPQTGIYFVPGISFDVFFYNGYWWSPRGDRWYRSNRYNGSWVVVERNYVPAHLYKVPRNYREVYKKERHVNYGQWKKQGQNNNDNDRKDNKKDKRGK